MKLALPPYDALAAPADGLSSDLYRSQADRGPLRSALRTLAAAFAQPFSLIDARTGEILFAAASGLMCDYSTRLAVLQETNRRGLPEIVEDEPPLSMLAIPLLRLELGNDLVAVGVFTNMQVATEAEIASAAKVFGVDAGRALQWSRSCEVWPPRVLLRLAESTVENIVQRTQLSHLDHQINEAVGHARDTYVELGLLHRLARHLDVSQDPQGLLSRAVSWLAEAVPAQCIAVVGAGEPASDEELSVEGYTDSLVQGECPLNLLEIRQMVDRLGSRNRRPLVLSREQTAAPTWGFPTVRELACVPIAEGSKIKGWLLAINYAGTQTGDLCEFGSTEVRLLDSVAAILGVHRSNTSLFHRQGDLFAASVRALTSAIDAKDQYTHGHSGRVARVAVCLAEELGLSRSEIDTVYLGGLLHDIGKIGVDDQVLNKPGGLTPEEFEQVKQHPQLGYDILRGVQQLESILPIVLHHHEAWDGSGYPHGLQGEATPLLARVTAVADAYDAMSSDRPYRSGMADEKLDAIFRDGAGAQWDPAVIDAFFACRERIRGATDDEAIGAVTLDPLQWVS